MCIIPNGRRMSNLQEVFGVMNGCLGMELYTMGLDYAYPLISFSLGYVATSLFGAKYLKHFMKNDAVELHLAL